MNFETLYKQANLKETETASAGGTSSIESNAPEHVIEVVNGQSKIDLKESTFNRIRARNLLNEKLFELVDKKSKNFSEVIPLKEAAFDAAKSWILFEKEEERKGRNSPRYKLQDWTNGGGGDGTEKGQPSAYEAWRRGIIDKKRKARLQQEYEDETNPFKSPTTTDVSEKTLDNQSDQFLSWWLEHIANR
jgi:hypothetical protein